MEIPIITTDHVGCKDIVEDGVNGYLCRPRDVKDLEKKIITILDLTELQRKQLGKSGRKKILRTFDDKYVINYYFKKLGVNPIIDLDERKKLA